MATFSTARTVTTAIIGLTILTAGGFPGEAASKAKPRKYIFDDLVTPSMLAPPSQPVRVQQAGGARFFSINSVLAKLDGKPATEQPIRLASAANDDVLSDAPSGLINMERTLQTTNEPFGLFSFRAPEGVLWRKWRGAKAAVEAELRQVEDCKTDTSRCSDAARRFQLIVDEVRNQSGVARLETANRLINTAIRYTSDLSQHAALDVWSAPLASLETGRGDCEDYAIAKYVVLREAGVPEQDLRILLVRDRRVREDHAVLTVRDGGTWSVLDNRSAKLAIDSEVLHFTPLYALDSAGVSLFASPYLTQRLNRAAKAVLPASDAMSSEGVSTGWSQEASATTDAGDAGMSFAGSSSGATTLPILM